MENRCVCCGAIIPEGRMVCPMCEMEATTDSTMSAHPTPMFMRPMCTGGKKHKKTLAHNSL